MKGYPQTSYDLSPTFSNSAELINQETAKEGKDYIYLSNKFKTVDFNLFPDKSRICIDKWTNQELNIK